MHDNDRIWRDVAWLAADLAFETDAQGRFTLIEPNKVLGWPAAELIGQPASALLPDDASGFDPFLPGAPYRRRRVQLRTPDGMATVLISAAPLLDEAGGRHGARGVAQDVTRNEARDAGALAERRRGEALLRITGAMRREVLPSRRLQAVLDGLMTALAAEGVAVAELFGRQSPPVSRQRAGAGHETLPAALSVLAADDTEPVQGKAQDGRPVIACPAVTRFGERVALAAWRAPAAAPWTGGDLQLLAQIGAVVGGVLEHDSIQREMARQIRNDPLTGLLNRRAFLDEALRRIDRLDREEQAGTLMLIDLDDFAPMGRMGVEAGDEALCTMARLLRTALRPADLVARLGGGGFATWMDGADELTGAERAEMLRLQVPTELAHLTASPGMPLTVSIGIACRKPSRGEELDSLMRRAGLRWKTRAMAGGGCRMRSRGRNN